MLNHPLRLVEQLSEEQQESTLGTSFRILRECGLCIQNEDAVTALAQAGCHITSDARVLFPRPLCLDYLAQAPTQFVLRARDSRYDITVGGNHLLISPGYGSAFVADCFGKRRDATLKDFRSFALLAGRSEVVDITGGLLVEPADVPPDRRPEVLTRTLLDCSPKPLLGSVAGTEGAHASLAVVREVFPDLETKPAVMALININSPLRLDARMSEALLVYVRAGQPVILTPGIMQGITAPVTLAGALAQAFAELIGCVTLTQVVRPGAPVVIGLGGFASDLRVAGSGFGRPEHAASTLIGAQLARHLRLPYRASPAVTGAFLADARCGYETMLTALVAWNCGTHVALQALGTLDQINVMSYEKFVLDLEIWEYLKRMAAPPVVTGETLALDTICELPSDYLTQEHTLRHWREALFMPQLAPPLSYDAWQAQDCPDALDIAQERALQLLADAKAETFDTQKNWGQVPTGETGNTMRRKRK